jgi:hypothetical protein
MIHILALPIFITLIQAKKLPRSFYENADTSMKVKVEFDTNFVDIVNETFCNNPNIYYNATVNKVGLTCNVLLLIKLLYITV